VHPGGFVAADELDGMELRLAGGADVGDVVAGASATSSIIVPASASPGGT
jgi:hypothetical protein